MAAPTWPGVTEYLYQAASPALVARDGTAIVPSGLSPRLSSFDRTPISGMETDTGTDRRSAGPFTAAAPTAPAAEGAGDGARCCASTAKAMAPPPAMTSATPAMPDSLTLARPRGGGAGANWLSGQAMTTRIPAIRGQRPKAFTSREGAPHQRLSVFRLGCYLSCSLMSAGETRHWAAAGHRSAWPPAVPYGLPGKAPAGPCPAINSPPVTLSRPPAP